MVAAAADLNRCWRRGVLWLFRPWRRYTNLCVVGQFFCTLTRTLGEAGVPWIPGRVALESLTDARTLVLGDDVLIEGHVHRID